ncbi:hypothetical protein PG994_004002 [Apiospora phragmitis]|uniref:Uncharacterized protein n=1 Tax=Apiospora phragmitis TaxID=2905665 RepID=A0ABR1W2N3_9PEZI
MYKQTVVSARRLLAYLLLWNGPEVVARPNPQEPSPSASQTIRPVTSVITVDGKTVTATATTVTTKDDSGKTIAVAVAVGAGVVAGGALAGWLFEPVPGVPPAPTSPPPYPTSTQDPPEVITHKDTTTKQTTTTTSATACPFPTQGSHVTFTPGPRQPKWTAEIPSQTTSAYVPKCTSSRDGQLLRGLDPEFINELADVFCKNDQARDLTKTLGKDDLPDGSSWKRANGPDEKVKFSLAVKDQADKERCQAHCPKAFSQLVLHCQYNSHYLFGNGTQEQGCGTYTLGIQGDPILERTCTGDKGNPLQDYERRDAALDAIQNFCTAQDGKVVKKDDEGSFIKESAFTFSYAKQCVGSGSYTLKKDLCVKYLMKTVDECDTNTVDFKHGGSLQDMDNCGLFEFRPRRYASIMCYPEAKEKGYMSDRTHVTVTKDMAKDAINAFCDRSGNGQQYTLDPANPPGSGKFVQDTCQEKGLAACGYFYRKDGQRVESGSGDADILIRLSARHWNIQDQMTCGPSRVYEIHGDRYVSSRPRQYLRAPHAEIKLEC